MQAWALFKAFFVEAPRENHMIIQMALGSGYHTANMVTKVPESQFQTCDVAIFYAQPNCMEETTPSMTTA
jgi:hypothetical protein